jgi:hypothetical protein
MTDKIGTNVAKIISGVLHPYVAFSLVVALIAYQENPTMVAWVKWTVVALLTAYLFPLIYMRARIYVVAHTTGSQMSLRSFFREQPAEMALLACLFGIPSAAIPYFLGYPFSITVTLVGVAATALVIALVNRIYRASFHLALFTSMMISLVVIFGVPPLVVIPFILLLWVSRYYLGKHTLLQLTAGFLLGLMVTAAVFYGFGILQ